MTAQNPPDEAVELELEGIALLARYEHLLDMFLVMGWEHNADPDGPSQQTLFVHPGDGHPVKRFKLSFQDGYLVGLTAWYRAADPQRHAMRHDFARHRHDGEGWVMCDAHERVLVQIDDAGGRLQALHTGVLADRDEVERLYRCFLPGADVAAE